MDKGELPVTGRVVECSECGRKFLIERALIGVDHTAGIIVTCLECLDEEDFPNRGIFECNECGRKISIERNLIGVNHTAGFIVNCWECLSEEQKKEAKEKYHVETGA